MFQGQAMRVSLTRCAYVAAILAVTGFAVYELRGPDGFPALTKKREEIQQIEKRNAELAREIELMRGKIKRLRENPSELELEIRKQMKLVRPGEKVFVLQDQPAGDKGTGRQGDGTAH
jgi:cell division protein FtsB